MEKPRGAMIPVASDGSLLSWQERKKRGREAELLFFSTRYSSTSRGRMAGAGRRGFGLGGCWALEPRFEDLESPESPEL